MLRGLQQDRTRRRLINTQNSQSTRQLQLQQRLKLGPLVSKPSLCYTTWKSSIRKRSERGSRFVPLLLLCEADMNASSAAHMAASHVFLSGI